MREAGWHRGKSSPEFYFPFLPRCLQSCKRFSSYVPEASMISRCPRLAQKMMVANIELQCFHALASLYQGQLVAGAQVQHDIVDLLMFLFSKDNELQEGMGDWLVEYFQRNPETPLRMILETLGNRGPVTVGTGAPLGPGITVLLDGATEYY
ncbi:hypothetical protein F5Y14DRAFT_409356 [Nemania sp. NC0429]|nr:hypothetical protein F5Y14DRAFT_409356 [Nemania sp. NC0429]